MSHKAVILLSLLLLGSAGGAQDTVLKPKKYEVTASDDSKVIIQRWGAKVPVLTYVVEGRPMKVLSPSLAEVENPQIDSLEITGGVFFHKELDGVGYQCVSFLFGKRIRDGKTPDTSYCRMKFLFYKGKFQDVSVEVPIAENSHQALSRDGGKGDYTAGVGRRFATLSAYLKQLKSKD